MARSLLLIVLWAWQTQAEEQRIIISEPLGVLTFLESLANVPNRPLSLKKKFNRSSYNNPKSRLMLREFSLLHKEFESRNSNPNTPAAINFSQKILKASVTRNEGEFFNWLKSRLSPSKFRKFKKIYQQAKPIYQGLVAKSSSSSMKKFVKEMQKTAKKWKFAEWTNCAAKFLQANPQSAKVSPVGLYPTPGDGQVYGESYVGVEVMGVDPKSKDFHGNHSVIFHEKIHTLYANQSSQLFKMHQSLFQGSKGASMAYDNFEEALCTVIGNVWAYKKATGKRPSEPWYGDPKIDAYAKAIAPMTEQYLASCKPMDKSFIKKAIQFHKSLNVEQDTYQGMSPPAVR